MRGKQGTDCQDRDNLTQFNTPVDAGAGMPSNILKSWGSPAYFNHTVYLLANDRLKWRRDARLGCRIGGVELGGLFERRYPHFVGQRIEQRDRLGREQRTHILHAYNGTNGPMEFRTKNLILWRTKFSVLRGGLCSAVVINPASDQNSRLTIN